MRALWWTMFLVACGGVSEDEFREEFTAKSCDLLFECAGDETTLFFFETPEDCRMFLSFVWTAVPDECDYDRKAAKECLQAMDDATCDEQEPEGYSACEEVYTGDGCNVFSTSTSTAASTGFTTTYGM